MKKNAKSHRVSICTYLQTSRATSTGPRRLDKEPGVEYGAQQDQRRYNPDRYRQLAGPHPLTSRPPPRASAIAPPVARRGYQQNSHQGGLRAQLRAYVVDSHRPMPTDLVVGVAGIHRKRYPIVIGLLQEDRAYGAVGNLDALVYQPLVDGGALQVSVWRRPLLADDSDDFRVQPFLANVFGYGKSLLASQHPPPPGPLRASERLP